MADEKRIPGTGGGGDSGDSGGGDGGSTGGDTAVTGTLSPAQFIAGWETGKAFWNQNFGQLSLKTKALFAALGGSVIITFATAMIETVFNTIAAAKLLFRSVFGFFGRVQSCLIGDSCRLPGTDDFEAGREGGGDLVARLFQETGDALPQGWEAFVVGLAIAFGVAIVASIVFRWVVD